LKPRLARWRAAIDPLLAAATRTPHRTYFHLGLRALKQRKVRSLLALLGMVFGVSAVVAMFSILIGLRLSACGVRPAARGGRGPRVPLPAASRH